MRRVNAQREQGWRARLIDTATEKLRRKERVGGRKRERERAAGEVKEGTEGIKKWIRRNGGIKVVGSFRERCDVVSAAE